MKEDITILKGNLNEVIEVSRLIPELENPYPLPEYSKRLFGIPHLILTARFQGQLAGFKVGYQREDDGSFYSWMGGVVPGYRRKRIARLLAEAQEAWAREQGYNSIRFKTQNRLKAMISFALNNGFQIIGVEPATQVEENRIWLEKSL